MHFAQPMFLLVALALGLALTLLFAHQAAARRRALARLGSPHLLRELTSSVSTPRRRVKEIMLLTGVVLVAVALARPQLGFRWEEAHRRGVDILFAVDTSKSMLTPDLKPNRLERAKLAVRDLVTKFPDDRVGLVAFAGNAFLETPLTLDHAIFEQSLATLDTSTIPLGGTNVASAIGVAEKTLADDTHKKILVLLTDGEDLQGEALSAAEAAAKQGLVVYTVGVGTPSGELIPIQAKGGATGFVKDDAGRFVTSKLDESLLRRIAAATGGSYRALGDNGQGLALLYEEDLATLPRSDLAARSQKVPLERFQWPLGLGVLLLGLEPLISERRRARALPAAAKVPRRHAWRGRWRTTSVAAAMLVLLPAVAFASPQSAERAYRSGQFKVAEGQYADAAKAKPDDPRLIFNLGDSSYRTGDLESAKKGFEGALHTSDLRLQEQAYYNLGDALYRTGEATLKDGKTDDTIGTWKQAVADYEAALHLDATDADAKFNRDFVNRRLAELEKKKDDEKKDDPKQPPKSGQDKKKDPSKGGGQDKDPSPSGSSAGEQPKGQKPKGPGQGEPAPASPAGANGPDSAEGETPSAPGELSKSEARALLDSLRGELQVRTVRTRSPMDTAKQASEEPPQKDW